MSVGSIIGGGLRLVRTQPQVVAIWAALYAVILGIGMVAMRPFIADMAAFQHVAAANAAAGIHTPPAFPIEMVQDIVALDLGFAIFVIMAFAAGVRATANPSGDRFAYLRLGMDELRLAGLALLLFAIAIAVELVAILALILVAALFGLLLGKAAGLIAMGVLMVGLFGAAIWAEVRLSLTAAYTVLRGRIVVVDAWRATRGRFWTLFGAYAVIAVAAMVLGLLMILATNPHLLSAYASLDQQAINAAAQDQIAHQFASPVALVAQVAIGSILYALMGTVAVGAITTAAIECGALAAPVD